MNRATISTSRQNGSTERTTRTFYNDSKIMIKEVGFPLGLQDETIEADYYMRDRTDTCFCIYGKRLSTIEAFTRRIPDIGYIGNS